MSLGKYHILTRETRTGESAPLTGVARARVPTHERAYATQVGAYFVEAALVTPLVLLITFASIFFCVLAAKNFALQSFATDIARDISLSLQTTPSATATPRPWCTLCPVRAQSSTSVDMSVFKQAHLSCWQSCAQTKYPIGILNAGGQALDISIDTYPIAQWYDATFTPSATVGPGDLFNVSVRYPSSNFLNGKVPFLGTLSFNIEGTAVGVIEKP